MQPKVRKLLIDLTISCEEIQSFTKEKVLTTF